MDWLAPYLRASLNSLRNRRRWSRFAIQVTVYGGVWTAAEWIRPVDSVVYIILLTSLAAATSSFVSHAFLPTREPMRQADHLEGEYPLILIAPGPRRLNVIKELRARCGMSYREARRRVDSTPTTFRVGNDPSEAKEIAGVLRRAGATVDLPVPQTGATLS